MNIFASKQVGFSPFGDSARITKGKGMFSREIKSQGAFSVKIGYFLHRAKFKLKKST
jgi:hypothetical protein